MMKMKFLILFFIFRSAGYICFSQEITENPIWVKEQKIREYFDKIYLSPTDQLKRIYNDSVLLLLNEVISLPESFIYPFDSLKRMGKPTSPDGQFRIYNWNLSNLNGKYEYFCFIQKYCKKEKKYTLYALADKSNEIKNPENVLLDHNNWYGALYYKIIPVKHKKKEYYVLLGLHLNNHRTTKKLIESLYFDENGLPKFGADVFVMNNKKQKRVIFEYSSNVSMSLNTVEKDKVILYDHLSPSKPSLVGKYEHYGPDFSYDALVLKKGVWQYVSDYDARNTE